MSEDKSLASARAILDGYIASRNMRKTPERYAILDKVCALGPRFDMDSLSSAMEDDGFRVSRATLYSAMKLFDDCGIVRRHTSGVGRTCYEVESRGANHIHLICRKCGKVKEAKDPELVKAVASRRFSAFSSDYFCLYVSGLCNSCARRMRRSSATKDNTTA